VEEFKELTAETQTTLSQRREDSIYSHLRRAAIDHHGCNAGFHDRDKSASGLPAVLENQDQPGPRGARSPPLIGHLWD